MTDLIRDIAERLAKIERELQANATAPRAPITSVQGGAIRFLDNGGGEAVRIGLNSMGDPTLHAWNDDGTARVLDVQAGVMRRPAFTTAWQRDLNRPIDGNGRPLISSGSYTAAWSALIYLGGGQVNSTIFLDVGAGVTSAAARITALLVGVYEDDGALVTAGGGTQTVVEWTGITASQTLSAGPWTVPDAIRSPAASPVGTVVQLYLEGRVTGGAGDIWLGPGPILAS